MSRVLLLIVLGITAFISNELLTVRAQDTQQTPVQVFLRRDIDAAGTDELSFIDPLAGGTTVVEVNGERYSVAGRAVIFYQPQERLVMQALADGIVRPHPFIQPNTDFYHIDWVVSADGKHLAWTVTTGTSAALITTTATANLDGTNARQIMVDGPRSGVRAIPIGFSSDHLDLFMDYQPDGISDFTPFSQYAGLFSLNVETGAVSFLPEEPGCYCGAGTGAGLFLRLALNDDLSGFDLNVHPLGSEVKQTIPALTLPNFTQAGDVLIAPDGHKAVYALAQVSGFGTTSQSVRTVFVLADLQEMTQAALTEPITTFVRPRAWTEDNSAILFTSPERDGTWKINLADGMLDKIAEATYLGTLSAG